MKRYNSWIPRGHAPNIWPLKNKENVMVCKRWFQLFGFSKTHPKRDELRRGYILLGVAAGCADEPWHAMARASKVGDVTLKQRELMKNRDLTNKSG